MEEDDLIDQVKQFIAQETGNPVEKVHLHSRICRDLGFDGEGAVFLFEDFASQFEIDRASLSALDIQKHFGVQPPGCLGWIVFGIISAIFSLWYNLGEDLGFFSCGSILFALIATYLVLFLIGFVLSRIPISIDNRFDQEEITVRDFVDAAQAKRWIATK